MTWGSNSGSVELRHTKKNPNIFFFLVLICHLGGWNASSINQARTGCCFSSDASDVGVSFRARCDVAPLYSHTLTLSSAGGCAAGWDREAPPSVCASPSARLRPRRCGTACALSITDKQTSPTRRLGELMLLIMVISLPDRPVRAHPCIPGKCACAQWTRWMEQKNK